MIFDGEPGLEIDEDDSYWVPPGPGVGACEAVEIPRCLDVPGS